MAERQMKKHNPLRRVFLCLAFLCSQAMAAEITVVACPGFTPVIYAESGKCPPLLSAAGLAVTSTTATVSYSTDTGNGNSYAYVGLPSGGSCPGPGTVGRQRKDLIAGTGATASNSAAIASSGAKTLGVTGLSPSTNYCIYLAQINSSGRASNRITQLFTTEASSPTSPASTGLGDPNYIYVVDSVTGNDSNTGVGYANAWRTLTKATNTVMPGGADLCVMDDSTYSKQRLGINHSGTEGDPAYHGGCYIDTGNSNTLTAWEYGTGTGRGAKPKITGSLTANCIANWNCSGFLNGNWATSVSSPSAYTVCTNAYDGIVLAQNKSWIEIVGFNIEYVECAPIVVSGAGSAAGNIGSIHHIRIAENTTAYTGGYYAIVVEKGWEQVVIEDNEASNKGLCRSQSLRTGVAYTCATDFWGGTIVANQRGRYLLQENNYVHDTTGEGINATKYSSGVIQRGNRVGNVHSAALYMDGGSGVAESNIVWGNALGTGVDDRPRGGGAIKVVNEFLDSSPATGLFRSNISVSARGSSLSADAFVAAAKGPCAITNDVHTGANNVSVFTNAAANYPVNGYVNYTIKNKTDNSTGTITANAKTTVTVTLSGGTDNDFDYGDSVWICKSYVTMKTFGNTLITPTNNTGPFMYRNGVFAASGVNNLIFAPSVSESLQCYIQNDSVRPVLNYNGWSIQPSKTVCRGANDVVTLSGFNMPKTEAQYLLASSSNIPTATAWAKPGGGSSAIGAGTTVAPASDTCLDMRDFGASTATGSDSWILEYADYPFTPTWSTWVKCHPYYFDGTAYDGDLGAVNP